MERAEHTSSNDDEKNETPLAEARTLRIDVLQNCLVVDKLGEEVGTVDDIVIDLASGRITHVLVSYGDWLNSKTAAVPWRALRVDRAAACLILQSDVSGLADGRELGVASDDMQV